jgi:hypothetical protein
MLTVRFCGEWDARHEARCSRTRSLAEKGPSACFSLLEQLLVE